MTNKVRRFTSIIAAAMIAVSCAFSVPKKAAAAEQADINTMIDELAALVNEAREEAGLQPLYLTPTLCETATVRALECITSFSHTRPNGLKFHTALDFNIVPFMKVAENLAAGNSTAEATFEQWRNSPSHWASIMNPNFTHIGIGIAYDPNSIFGWYWTETFVTTNVELEGQRIVEMDQIAPLSMVPETPAVPTLYGDVNADGRVNSFDTISLANYLFGKEQLDESQLEAADVMQDGSVNIADLIVLRRYIMGAYNSLPIAPDAV